MTNVLPQQLGLQVNSVIYRYTTIKDIDDELFVTVQNENPEGGYIFREVDDWTGIPGNSINKVVAVGGQPIERWGDGSVTWQGDGQVTDPYVVYTYQYDTCFDPQTDPECPGYKPTIPDIPNVEPVDPLADDLVQDEIDREMTMRDEDEDDRERRLVAEEKEEEEVEVDLETILGVVSLSLQGAQDTALHNRQMALNSFSQGYFQQLPDTKYEETIQLQDSELPTNRRAGRLEFAQDLLHVQMIKSQYER